MNYKNIIFLISVVSFPPSHTARGQITHDPNSSGSIYGFVKSGMDSTVVVGANVVLVGTGLGDASNEFGFYRISNLPPGRYIVEITSIGYGRFMAEVLLEATQNVVVDAYLRVEPIVLEEIIKWAPPPEIVKEIPISSYEMEAIELRAAAVTVAQPDIFKSIQMLPGVLSMTDFASAFYVRGGTPDQNLVLLDGAVVYNPYHLSGFFSTFNTDVISGAEFMVGGFPAPHGGRVSSILNVSTSPGDTTRWHAKADVNPLLAGITVNGPVPYGSMTIGARRSLKNYIDVLNQQKVYGYKMPPYSFDDLQGKIEFKPTISHTISFSGYYNRDLLDGFRMGERTFESEDVYVPYLDSLMVGSWIDDDRFDLSMEWGNRVGSLNWTYNSGGLLLLQSTLAFSRFRNDMELFDAQMEPTHIRLDNTLENRKYRLEMVLRPELFQFRAGLEGQREEFSYNLLGQGQDLIHATRAMNTVSPYADITLDYWNILRVQAGVRYNIFDLDNLSSPDYYIPVFPRYTHELRWFEPGKRTQLEPRLGIKYQLHERVVLTGAYGIYHQNIYSLPLQDESSISLMDIWFPLDMKYNALRARHLIGGLRFYLPDKFSLSFEAYHKKLDNMLEFNDYYFQEEPEGYYTEGGGTMNGFEVLIRRSHRAFYTWLGYTYSRAKGNFGDRAYNLRYDRRHSVNLVFHWISWDGLWESTITWQYGSGFPFTRVNGRYRFPLIYSVPGGGWTQDIPYMTKFDKGAKNGSNYPAYHRMDMAIRRNYEFGPFRAKGYLQVINLYNNRKNILFLWQSQLADFEYTNRRYDHPIAQPIRMFPILFTAGFQVEI